MPITIIYKMADQSIISITFPKGVEIEKIVYIDINKDYELAILN